jgi:putative PIN family toxin of toxin-antitoxin system
VKNNKSNYRIVLDTNVLVSAIVFGGKPREILDIFAENNVTVVIAEEIITELRRKIITKFPEFTRDFVAIERLLKRDSMIVKLGTVHINASRDADDNKFIETALIGECQFLVSGDKDLLVLGSYLNIKIVKPTQFLGILSKI